MPSKLEQLRSITDVVADTGDLHAIETYKPMDATTNPSLLLQAVDMESWKPTIEQIAETVRSLPDSEHQIAEACELFAVEVGKKISNIIPGRVSTEVDARLSFDTEATVNAARKLIERYAQAGVHSSRVLIKIASTWEGIQAARTLEREGINCNLTLLFNLTQAIASADAGAFLISPFVGRILDWHIANGTPPKQASDDPGVQSVRRIYDYYKSNNYSTVVMGASFRNTGQIEELAGCDRLTISPALLAELETDADPLARKLDPQNRSNMQPVNQTQSSFLWELNDDAMAHQKLADGIRKFAADQVKLESVMADLIAAKP